MRRKQAPNRIVIYSLAEIPRFASEAEERDWWATHDLAPELDEEAQSRKVSLSNNSKRSIATGLIKATPPLSPA